MSTGQFKMIEKLDKIVIQEGNGYKYLCEKDGDWYTRNLTMPEQHELAVVLLEERQALKAENDRLQALLNRPEIEDFLLGVKIEAAHQVERWTADHDAGKGPLDWFWLIGYLSQKAVHSHIMGDKEKHLHHVITTAAGLANWHSCMLGNADMRPGINAEELGV